MILFSLLSVIFSFASACAPFTGDMSKMVQLHFSVSPPPKYTYSDFPALGQTSSAKVAENNADRDIKAAILSTLTENGIPIEMATLQYEYKAPKLLLAEGSRCEKPNTYIVYDGAIMYKCVEEKPAVKLRGKREASTVTTVVETTTEMEMQTTTDRSSTQESQGTTVVAPTTVKVQTTTDNTVTPKSHATTGLATTPDSERTPVPETTTRSSPESEVKPVQYHIVGAVTVETPQSIFESQWNLLAAEIQAKLEKHHVLFTEDIKVEPF